MKQVVATLSASLDIECPKCDEKIDLLNDDSDFVYGEPIFNNRWDALSGEEVICPNCNHEFEISGIEW